MKTIITLPLPEPNEYVDQVQSDAWPVVLSFSAAFIGIALTASILKALRG